MGACHALPAATARRGPDPIVSHDLSPVRQGTLTKHSGAAPQTCPSGSGTDHVERPLWGRQSAELRPGHRPTIAKQSNIQFLLPPLNNTISSVGDRPCSQFCCCWLRIRPIISFRELRNLSTSFRGLPRNHVQNSSGN